MEEIRFTARKELKEKPDFKNLGFGKYFSDYMFRMDYTRGRGWHDPSIRPYGPISLDPSAMVFHYGLETFEGLKSYYTEDGRILLFRPDKNAERMNNSNDRLCMPPIPVDDYVEYVKALIRLEKDWIPTEPGTSLYIRPVTIATEHSVGVHPSANYIFYIILSPVGAYYKTGLDPVKIYVEDEYVRAVPGGTGFTKCGGNYAASVKAQEKAEELGFTQVLWLDGKERKYVEEVGTMNIMFKIAGEIYTAALNGSILPGITRDSCIQLLKSWGYQVNEAPLPIDFIMDAYDKGQLEEVFGTGTAAVISPVGELKYEGKTAIINDSKTGPLSQKLYDHLTGIQWGKVKDEFGWTVEVK